MGPLHGVRVLEFSQIVAGPVAGLNLADLGADVIKIEPPAGDPHRNVGTTVPGESKMYQGNNRGKRGVVIDLQDDRGKDLVRKLVSTADVIVINYRPGVAARIGIDYESVCRIRPNIIYAQLSGFGETGSAASRGGSDIVAQAYSGLMAMDGKIDAAGTPQLVGIPLSDYAAGLAVAMGVCAALLHREKTGEGQYLSTSLLRAGLHLQNRYVMREPVSDATLRDALVERVQEARAAGGTFADMLKARQEGARLATPFTNFYRAYHAADGAVVLGALTPQNRAAIRRVIGLEGDHSDEPGYDARAPESLAAGQRIKEWMEQQMRQKPVDEWVRLFEAAGVPVARVNFPEEMSDDPQVLADGIMVELEHTVTGPQRVVGPILQMSATPTGSPLPAPTLGEHTSAVLEEIGLGEADIAALAASGVVKTYS